MKELLLYAHKISKYSKHYLLNSINLKLYRGETYALMGPSGSGKTTLAKILTAYIKPTLGTVLLQGKQLFKPCKDLQLIEQNPIHSFTPHLKLRHSLSSKIACSEHHLMHLLTELNLDKDILNRYPHEISGGEAQRLALVRALLVKPKLLICDEILSSLNEKLKMQILLFLKKQQQKTYFSILWISHDLDEALSLCNSFFVLENGRLVESFLSHELEDRKHSNFIRGYVKTMGEYKRVESK